MTKTEIKIYKNINIFKKTIKITKLPQKIAKTKTEIKINKNKIYLKKQ